MEDLYQTPAESQLDPLTRLVLSLQQRAAQAQPGVVTGLRKFLFGTHPIEGSPHPGMFDLAPGLKPWALGLASIPGVAGRAARYAGRPGASQSVRARIPGVESATEEYIQGPGVLAMDEALGLRNPYAYAPTNPKDPLGEVAKQQAGRYLAERLKQLKEQYARARQQASAQGAEPDMERQFTGGQPRNPWLDREVTLEILPDRRNRQIEFFQRLTDYVTDRNIRSMEASDWRPMLVRYHEFRRGGMLPEDAFRFVAAEWEATRRAGPSTSP